MTSTQADAVLGLTAHLGLRGHLVPGKLSLWPHAQHTAVLRKLE